jgi:phosphoenolpyruvate carboxykinase (ATP)
MILQELRRHNLIPASSYGLDRHGLSGLGEQHWNFHTPQLIEEALRRHEGMLAHLGALVVYTGEHTGRSPEDKFIVRGTETEDNIWWGGIHHPLDEAHFQHLYDRIQAYLVGKELFIQDCFAGADRRYRVPIRVISELAWHSLFARTLFIRPTDSDLVYHMPTFTVIDVPHFQANPEIDGTVSPTFIVLNFSRRIALIGGTEYAGEIKKAVFTLLNDLMPKEQALPMHCSANYGNSRDDVALFFGLSGTGKTTLGADSRRTLIGDDEHIWNHEGIFNIEGGSYIKAIHLSRIGEPQVYEMTRRFGTLLENVVIDPSTRYTNLDDESITENTRATYALSYLPNADLAGMGGHPRNIIFLTADAFGVLPSIARLTPEQALYHFLNGYTSTIGGTEWRLGCEPIATFSPCFAAPFLPMHPMTYVNLFADRLNEHPSKVWLVNTGWAGGPYGVGRRIPLAYTRAIVTAILSGELDNANYVIDEIFGLATPTHIRNVPDTLLNQRHSWGDVVAYDQKARELAASFNTNFEQYADRAGSLIRNGGPVRYRSVSV